MQARCRAGASILLAAGLLTAPAHGGDAPVPIRPEELRWTSAPGTPGIQAAWVIGSEEAAEPYLLRVRLVPGAKLPPHFHPDARSTTVLSGTLHVGFGERFDEAALVAVAAGAVYVAPARVPHFLWARDGEVVYQESGVGPTGNTLLPAR